MLALLIFWKQVYSKVYNKQTIWYLSSENLLGLFYVRYELFKTMSMSSFA